MDNFFDRFDGVEQTQIRVALDLTQHLQRIAVPTVGELKTLTKDEATRLIVIGSMLAQLTDEARKLIIEARERYKLTN